MTTRPKLSEARLAEEAGVEPSYVRLLVDAGALHVDEDGLHELEDVLQIRLVQALAEGGIDLDDVVWAIREEGLPLDRIGAMWTLAESSGRTFTEFSDLLGDRGALLPSIYAAFGLAVPAPDTIMRQDEEQVLTGFLEVWGLVEDRPDVYVRAARIAGRACAGSSLRRPTCSTSSAGRPRRDCKTGSRPTRP